MQKRKIDHLKEKLKYMEEINQLAPFPIYDTEEIKDLKVEIDKFEVYENEEVECCKNCKNLHLIDDDFGNTWCKKCHSVNEIETLKDIDEYLKEYGDIW